MLDSKYLLIASAWLKGHATLPVANPEQPASYTIDFGQFENLAIKPEGDLKETWGPGVGGGIGLFDVRRTKTKLTYEANLKHLTPAFLAYFFGSATGGVPLPGKVVNLFCWLGLQGEGEPVVSAGTNIGDSLFRHHSFKAALTLDGDLTADGENFITAKLTARVLLGEAPGVWTAGARPLVSIPA